MLNLLVVSGLLLSPLGVVDTDDERELIMLVLVDALRPDHLGSYGYREPTAPNLDELARQGTRYTRAYANAPWTRPSTASFLTGLNASRHGIETAKSKLDEEQVVTLAQRLGDVGWKTAGFCANGNGGSLANLHAGFDVFEDPTNTYTRKVRGQTYNGLPTGEFIVDKALRHLRRSKAQREFVFLFLVDPHDPYRAPARLEKLFLGDYKGKIRRNALWEYNNDYTEAERRSMLAVYDAGIRYADEAIGQLVEGLKEMGRYESATIIVSADHGEGFGEHGFYLHAHHFWDEVVRVPLLIKSGRFEPGVDTRLTQSLDVTRTIAELAGAQVKGLPGRSLLAPPDPHSYAISEYNEFGIHRQAIVSERFKVIWQRPADRVWFNREVKKRAYFPSVSFDRDVVRVYDLKADPGEKHDLSAAMPGEAAELLRTLRKFVSESGQLTQR